MITTEFNLSVSEWLRESLEGNRALNDLLHQGRVYGVDNPLEGEITQAEEELYNSDPNNLPFGTVGLLSRRLQNLRVEGRNQTLIAYGRKIAEHALNVMDDYLGDKTVSDKSRGYELFLTSLKDEEISEPVVKGFAFRIRDELESLRGAA